MDFDILQDLLKNLPLGQIRFFNKTSSTNDEADRWIDTGAPDMSLVIADEQTNGRGRQGRKWFTPPNSALAISIILKELRTSLPLGNNYSPTSTISRLTCLGTIAICKSLEYNYKLEPQIKWPNDVLLQGKKVAGILAETKWQGEMCSSAILGIGVNVAPQSVPPRKELVFPATCIQTVLGESISRLELLHSILENLIQMRIQLFEPGFIDAWNKYLAYRGEWVDIIINDRNKTIDHLHAQVIGLDLDGNLKVRQTSGNIQTLFNGEISLRPKNILQ